MSKLNEIREYLDLRSTAPTEGTALRSLVDYLIEKEKSDAQPTPHIAIAEEEGTTWPFRVCCDPTGTRFFVRREDGDCPRYLNRDSTGFCTLSAAANIWETQDIAQARNECKVLFEQCHAPKKPAEPSRAAASLAPMHLSEEDAAELASKGVEPKQVSESEIVWPGRITFLGYRECSQCHYWVSFGDLYVQHSSQTFGTQISWKAISLGLREWISQRAQAMGFVVKKTPVKEDPKQPADAEPSLQDVITARLRLTAAEVGRLQGMLNDSVVEKEELRDILVGVSDACLTTGVLRQGTIADHARDVAKDWKRLRDSNERLLDVVQQALPIIEFRGYKDLYKMAKEAVESETTKTNQ